MFAALEIALEVAAFQVVACVLAFLTAILDKIITAFHKFYFIFFTLRPIFELGVRGHIARLILPRQLREIALIAAAAAARRLPRRAMRGRHLLSIIYRRY